MIEEIGLPVDIVVGTSMGAIVGGLYAAGYDSADLYRLVADVDWDTMFSDLLPRSLYRYRSRLASERYFAGTTFDSGGLRAGGGLLRGQNISALLDRLTFGIPADIQFDDLQRRYRAIAADILTGEQVVLDSGSIADAMRASMNIPGLFDPFQLGGRKLVDGGIVNNLPVDVARSLGADIVIAVETLEQLIDYETLRRSPLASLDQATRILVEANMQLQRKSADLLISPDLNGLSSSDFSRYDELSERGELAAREVQDELSTLAARLGQDPARAEAAVPGYVISYPTGRVVHITDVRVSGGTEADAEAARQLFSRHVGQAVRGTDLSDSVDALYSLGRFDLVRTRVVDDENRHAVLLVRLTPVERGQHRVQIGMSYFGSFSSTARSTLVLTPNVMLTNLSGEGSNLSLTASLVGSNGIEIEYFQPLAVNAYLRPIAGYLSSFDEFFTSSNVVVRHRNREATAGVDLGVVVSRFGELFAGYRLRWFESPIPAAETTMIATERFDEIIGAVLFGAGVDTRDSRHFPMSGGSARARYTTANPHLGGEVEYQLLQFDADLFVPIRDNASLGAVVLGGTDFATGEFRQEFPRPYRSFTVTDPRLFAVYDEEPFFGRHKLMAGLEARLRIRRADSFFGEGMYVSAHANAGNAWRSLPQSAGEFDLRWSVAMGVGLRLNAGMGIVLRAGVADGDQPFAAINAGSFGY